MRRSLREAAVCQYGPFSPANAGSLLTRSAEIISKSEISGSSNEFRASTHLVNYGPRLAEISETPFFGFCSKPGLRQRSRYRILARLGETGAWAVSVFAAAGVISPAKMSSSTNSARWSAAPGSSGVRSGVPGDSVAAAQ